MKMFKKIVAIALAALLLCSVLPLSVMAAETATLSFANKAQRTSFSTTSQVWEQNGVKFTNNKASSSNAVADYANPVRLYAGSEIIVECVGMTQIVFDCNSSSYATTLKNSIGTAATASSDKVTVTLDGVDSFTVAKLTAQVRVDAITVTYEAGSANCDHASLDCEETCPECGEYTKEHVWNNTCDNECNNCSAANPDYAEHVYTTEYDATCNVCNESRDVTLPTTPEEIVDAAYALGKGDTFGVATTLTGVITQIVTAYDSNFANITVDMAVIDSEGNAIADKDIQCYRLKGEGADTLVVGYTIVVTGVITNFNGTIEFNAGCTLDEVIIVCTHEYEYECSTTCSLCGLETRPEAEHSNDAAFECLDGNCDYCGDFIPGVGHVYDDEWDADCNYGCGETREVEERPEMTEATITFDADKTQRTEYSTAIQKWENDGLTFINNKASSTTNVGDYSNPGRFYKSSEIVISYPGMTSLVIDCSNTGDAKYSTPFGDMLTAAGLTYTVVDKVYTVTFAEPTDSITLSCSAQVRANAITAIAVKAKPACEHEYEYDCSTHCSICGEGEREASHVYFYPCDKVCMLCYEETNENATHSIVAVDAVAATCDTNGNIAYWYCSDCGSAWADEALTQVTNRMSIIVPAGHTYTDNCDSECDVCGEWRFDAPHNLTYVPGVVPATCLEEGYDEYWKCADCKAYFGDAEASWQINPGWMYYTGDCTRPEGSVPCAVVKCTVCGNDVYGEACTRPENAPVCQDAECIYCGETVWGWGCNYNTGDEEIPAPLCQPGDCVYCGTHYEKLYDCENGSWAPCSYDGECAYGCGKQYPATGEHVFEEGVSACDGGLCWLCWNEIEGTGHVYTNDYDTTCNACGIERAVVAPVISVKQSTSEDVMGLAMLFEANVAGFAVKDNTHVWADYTNATYNGCKLIETGVIASNGVSEVTIKGERMYDLGENGKALFAYRITNIPADKVDVVITMTPYYVIEIDGVATTIKGEPVSGSYNTVVVE